MSKRFGSKDSNLEDPADKKQKNNSTPSSSSQEGKDPKMVDDPQLSVLLTAIQEGKQENRVRFDALESKISKVDHKVDNLEGEVNVLKQRVAALEVENNNSGSSATSVTSSTTASRKKAKFRQPEHFSFEERDLDVENWRYSLPPHRRKVLVVGDLHEFEKEEADTIGAELAKQIGEGYEKEIERFEAPYKLGSILRIVCVSNSAMWGILRKMKKRKFCDPSDASRICWHGIDKSQQEREFGKRVGKAISDIKRHLKDALSTDDVDKLANGDRDSGLVWMRLPGKRTVRVFKGDQNKEFLEIAETFDKELCGGYQAEAVLDEINNLC